MPILRLIDSGILVTDNDLVRSKTYSDAHNCTNAHTHRGVHFVQPVQGCAVRATPFNYY